MNFDNLFTGIAFKLNIINNLIKYTYLDQIDTLSWPHNPLIKKLLKSQLVLIKPIVHD